MRGFVSFTTLVSLVLLSAGTGSAGAVFPGENGRILFVSDRTGNSDIWAMNADASSQTQITSFAGTDTTATFSPDRQKIAYQSEGVFEDIFQMNTDGSGIENLTSEASSNRHPAYSPDGAKIAFVSDRSGDDDIWLMNSDGTLPAKLTFEVTKEGAPTFSPDGSRIAFSGDSPLDPGNDKIRTIRANGTDISSVTDGASKDNNPDYSPDGATIAFDSNRSGDRNIHAVPAGGGPVTQLTVDPAFEVAPRFSPDGTTILFASNRRLGGGVFDIWRMDPDGSDQQILLETPASDIATSWEALPKVGGGQGPGPAPPDVTPPKIAIDGDRRGKAGKAIEVEVSCDEACVADVATTVKAKRKGRGNRAAPSRAAKTISLPSASLSIAAAQVETVRIVPERMQRRKLRRFAKRGLKLKATLDVIATDTAGNEAGATFKVKLRK